MSAAGGLGLIGGGYGDADWLGREFDAAGNQRVGCGFITWSLAKQPHLLQQALAHAPAAMMLSFGDPAPFAADVKSAGALLICQCQTVAHVREALRAGADVVVAQGGEAGGHGQDRGTLSFVPEAADVLARERPETLFVAAGGIADGRGLAAALMLGADGVLVGTRFWASQEALTHPDHHLAILAAGGDDTARTSLPDIARRLPWPKPFTARTARGGWIERWRGREAELEAQIETEGPRYGDAFAAGDGEGAAVWFGEAAGLIRTVEPAQRIVDSMVGEASLLLARGAPALVV